jgi:transposase-like protein
MTLKAERKRKSDASPVEFCRRSLAGGNVWDSLTDLLKIMKLRGLSADDVQEVREMVQHLFTTIVKPARSKRDSRQAKTHVDYVLLQLVDDIHLMWNADSFLDQAQELVKTAID